MSVFNRLLIVARTQLSKPEIFYHGTSDKFLRSILKQGLIPTAKEGRWVEEENYNDIGYRPSRKSVGGIYFTKKLGTASSAATNLTLKNKTNPLIIIAQLSQNSLSLDEDLLRDSFPDLQAANDSDYGLAIHLVVLYGLINNKDFSSKADMQRRVKAAWDTYCEINHINTKRPDIKKLYSLWFQLWVNDIKRRAAWNKETDKYKGLGYKIREMLERFFFKEYKEIVPGTENQRFPDYKSTNKPIPKFFRLESRGKYEAERRSLLNLLTQKIRSKKAVDDSFIKSVRINKPVGFKGRNRILQIVKLLKSETDKYRYNIVPVYPKNLTFADLNKDFKSQWKEQQGSKMEFNGEVHEL